MVCDKCEHSRASSISLETAKMANTEEREACVHSMRNIERFIQSDQFKKCSVVELKTKSKHLQKIFDRFMRVNAVLSKGADIKGKEEHQVVSDAFEHDYLDIMQSIDGRIDELSADSEQCKRRRL